MIGHVNQVESTGCWHIPRLKTKCLIRIRIFDIHICVWKLETKVVGNVLLPRLWGKETAEQPIDWWLKETNLSMLFIICPARSHLLILWFVDTLEESEVLHVETVNGFLKKTTASGQTFWGNEPSWTTGSGIRTAKYKYLSLSLNQLYLKSLHWKSHIFRRNKYLLVVNFISQCQITGGLFSIWSFLSNRKTTAVFNLVLFAPVAGSNRTSMGP